LKDPTDDLEQRALTAAIRSDESECFTLFESEVDVAEGPEVGVSRTGSWQEFAEPIDWATVQTIELRNVLDENQI
jgi:hypothetical protein